MFMQDAILEFSRAMLNNLAYQMFNIIILVSILAYFLYNPVKKFMKDRSDRISKQLEQADSICSDADKLKIKYEQKLKDIENERTQILENARKIAVESEKNIIENAKKEAEVIKSRALQQIKLEEEKSKDSLKTQMIEISMLIASRFIAANIDQSAQNKLLDEVISDLGDSKWLS